MKIPNMKLKLLLKGITFVPTTFMVGFGFAFYSRTFYVDREHRVILKEKQ